MMKFMHHVVGLDCDLTAFNSAWVCGIIRSSQQSRPLRRQSSILNVKSPLVFGNVPGRSEEGTG